MRVVAALVNDLFVQASGGGGQRSEYYGFYVSGDDLKTLPVGLAGIVGQYQIDWGFLLSGAVLASLPVILLFVFIGKYFVSGLTEGAIK